MKLNVSLPFKTFLPLYKGLGNINLEITQQSIERGLDNDCFALSQNQILLG